MANYGGTGTYYKDKNAKCGNNAYLLAYLMTKSN